MFSYKGYNENKKSIFVILMMVLEFHVRVF